MFIPKKGQAYDSIIINNDEGAHIVIKVMEYDSKELEASSNYQTIDIKSGNCFPFGSLCDHDLATLEDCIRGLHVVMPDFNGRTNVGKAEALAFKEEHKGKQDCINGVPHKEGRSAAYDRGYSEQYAIEQQQSERTK